MKPKIKKLLPTTAIFLSILAIIFIFVSVKKNAVPTTISPAKLTLPKQYKGQYSVELDVKQNDFQYIKELPILEIEKTTISTNKAQEIAEALKFSGSPVTINDPIDGPTYFWKNEKGTLFIYPRENKVKYTQNNDDYIINKQLSDEAIISLAITFLEENKIVEKGSLTTYHIKFLKKNSLLEGFIETTKNDASVYETEFVFKESGYEILELSSIEPSVLVDINKDGTIAFLQSKTPGDIKKSLTNYQLKDFQEIKGSIGAAVLVSILGQYLSISALPEKLVQKISVNKIEIAYLKESSNSIFLQPVYKLSGDAYLSDPPNKVPAVLYLPAIKEN